jgi:methionyl-tRNA formyltransferase
MKKEDGLIDWNMPARDIANRVRGFQPFPTAYTSYLGKKLTIWNANAVMTRISGAPGMILEAKGDNLKVSCGRGTALNIGELQIEGKRRMPVRDFLNGTKVKVGEELG